jgi:hypothetical protein
MVGYISFADIRNDEAAGRKAADRKVRGKTEAEGQIGRKGTETEAERQQAEWQKGTN